MAGHREPPGQARGQAPAHSCPVLVLPRPGSSTGAVSFGAPRLLRTVGEQLGRGLQPLQQPIVHRTQMPGGAADPVGERGAVEMNVPCRA